MSFPKLERAKTGRSTCRGCGEGIAADEMRVGIEAFVAGRVADTWQHPRCALNACFLEVAPAKRGKCKATDEPFAKGDARLALCSKDHKTFYGVKGMGDALRPILDAVDDFAVSNITGLADLDDENRAAVLAALGVDDDANAGAKKRARRSSAANVSVAEVKLGKAEVKAEASPATARVTRGGRRASGAASVGTPAAAEGKASRATPPASKPEPVDDGLTDFERERAALIARNKERMQALNIGVLASEVATAPATKSGPIQRGIGAKRQRAPKEEPGPLRRSGRVRNVAPDPALAGGVDYERRDGSVMLANGTSTGGWGEVQERGPSRPVGPVALESVNGEESADEAFIKFLRDTLSGPIESSTSFNKSGIGFLTAEAFSKSLEPLAKTKAKNGELAFPPTSAAGLAKAKLSLTDESVAKVVPRGVTHLDMAPYDPDGPLLVAAGDKDGNIGLWRVDNEDAGVSQEDGDGSEDGVLFYKPHGSYVCHLKWGRGGLGGKLITAAYDGVVRALDVQGGEQCFKELFVTDDEDEFSGCDVSADGRTIHLVDNHGNYHVVDARSGKLASAAVQLHEKKINTVHLEPGAERTIATSCGDQTVCVWDVRKTGKGAKPLSRLQHSKSCQAAYFSPDGKGSLLTTCYDDLLRVWRPKGGAIDEDPKSALKIKHNNQTGRWVLPFRAVWTPGSDGAVIGSMKREVEVFDAAKGTLAAKLSDAERMTAIASRFAVHPTRNIIAAGTASGRIHIYR
jgi:WD40 repeat protein